MAKPQWLRLGHRDSPPAPPSHVLGPALHRLRDLAGDSRHAAAIEAWLWLAGAVADLQPSFGRAERLTVHTTRQNVVVDIAVPDRSLIPAHSRVQYRPGADRLEPANLTDRIRTELVETLFGASVLAHTYVAAVAWGAVGLPTEWTITATRGNGPAIRRPANNSSCAVPRC